MALLALMLRKKIDGKKKTLEELRGKTADFEKREAELEQAIEEAETEEEKTAVEEEVTKFDAEKKENDDNIAKLENEIRELEADLEKEEKAQRSSEPPKENGKKEERKDIVVMERRTKFFGMNMQERDAFFAREDIKNFLNEVRTCIKEKRAVSNVGIIIPEVMLELLKTKVEQTSKLIGKVTLRSVSGTARQRIMGVIPEAVWTEMCATLNEMDLTFNDTEVDGYKVGGFFAVCNAIIEDNDVNLATEIINALGKAIGKALDKAIVYGTGNKMPLGIVTRLAQTSKPSDYSSTDREWKDLSTKNIVKGAGKTGIELFKEIVTNSGLIDNDYSEDGLIWVMNKKTHTKLMVQSMDKNLNAAIVAGISNEMPVVGGKIIELSFIPDDNIVFGYLDMYLLAERAGTQIAQSEHARFIEDQTVFKGTARYDGKPVIPEAFAVMSLTTTAPATSVSFSQDTANTVAASSENNG